MIGVSVADADDVDIFDCGVFNSINARIEKDASVVDVEYEATVA
jgi:hypothetical protein